MMIQKYALKVNVSGQDYEGDYHIIKGMIEVDFQGITKRTQAGNSKDNIKFVAENVLRAIIREELSRTATATR